MPRKGSDRKRIWKRNKRHEEWAMSRLQLDGASHGTLPSLGNGFLNSMDVLGEPIKISNLPFDTRWHEFVRDTEPTEFDHAIEAWGQASGLPDGFILLSDRVRWQWHGNHHNDKLSGFPTQIKFLTVSPVAYNYSITKTSHTQVSYDEIAEKFVSSDSVDLMGEKVGPSAPPFPFTRDPLDTTPRWSALSFRMEMFVGTANLDSPNHSMVLFDGDAQTVSIRSFLEVGIITLAHLAPNGTVTLRPRHGIVKPSQVVTELAHMYSSEPSHKLYTTVHEAIKASKPWPLGQQPRHEADNPQLSSAKKDHALCVQVCLALLVPRDQCQRHGDNWSSAYTLLPHATPYPAALFCRVIPVAMLAKLMSAHKIVDLARAARVRTSDSSPAFSP